MILIRLMGGLGNQMFQYAFGLMHQLQSGKELKIDTTLLGNTSDPNHVNRSYSLDYFKMDKNLSKDSEVKYFNGNHNPNIVDSVIYKMRRFLNPDLLIVQKGHDFNDSHITLKKNSCFVGRWQSERYFNKYSAEVREAFTFRDDIIDLNQQIINQILQMERSSVSLHLRRTDYATNYYYSKHIGVLGKNYFDEAIFYLSLKIPDPFYFIFSDDVMWADKIMREKNLNYMILSKEDAPNSDARDMLLMSKCQNHIISNSTFSWWGAWLGDASGITIAPKVWAKDAEFRPPFIFPSRWVQLENDFE